MYLLRNRKNLKGPKKILYIANSGQIGGGNRSLLTNIKCLLDTEFIPAVLIPENGPFLREIKKLGIEHRILSTHINSDESKLALLGKLIKCLSAILHCAPCLIHANDVFCYKLFGTASKILHIPILCHMRYSVEREAVDYHLRPVPDAVIFNSKFMEREFKRKNPLLAKLIRKAVIYNGFDPKEYNYAEHREHVRKQWGVDESDFVIGVVGNFAKVKRHEVFLKVADVLNRKYNDMFFVIAGDDILEDGKRKRRLVQMTKLMGLERKMRFLGWVKEIGKLLSGLDLLLVPSDFEPFGRVAVEGLLAGVPVIGSRIGGLVEILENNPLGRLVPPGSILEFVKEVEGIYNNKGDLPKRAGIILASRKFGVEENFGQLISLYREYCLKQGQQNYSAF